MLVSDACKVLDEMSKRDLLFWNAILSGLCREFGVMMIMFCCFTEGRIGSEFRDAGESPFCLWRVVRVQIRARDSLLLFHVQVCVVATSCWNILDWVLLELASIRICPQCRWFGADYWRKHAARPPFCSRAVAENLNFVKQWQFFRKWTSPIIVGLIRNKMSHEACAHFRQMLQNRSHA